MTEHYHWFYWFVPIGNMTEGAFAETMRRVSELPDTLAPVYEPLFPDAPLLSSVSLPCIGIGFADARLEASTEPHDRFDGLGVPDHLEYVRMYWEGWPLDYEGRDVEVLLEVVAAVAEGMGAVYGALVWQAEDVGGEVFVLTDLMREGRGVLFLGTELVELAGRSRVMGLGRTREVSNGIAFIQDAPGEELEPLIRELFARAEVLKGEPLEKMCERPSYVEEVQVVPRVLPEGRPYWASPWEKESA